MMDKSQEEILNWLLSAASSEGQSLYKYNGMSEEEYFSPHKCPVCGKFEFPTHGSFDICDVCGWEDDFSQEQDPEFGGANWEGLKGYRALYKAGMHEASNEEKRAWLVSHKIYDFT